MARPSPTSRRAPTPEIERRRRSAAPNIAESVLERLALCTPTRSTPTSEDETTSMMRDGVPLIVRPRLARDERRQRSASVHVLVRVGRDEERFAYSPILIKNHEVVESRALVAPLRARSSGCARARQRSLMASAHVRRCP